MVDRAEAADAGRARFLTPTSTFTPGELRYGRRRVL